MPRLSFAGLSIEVRADAPEALADLAPIYAQFATDAAPALVITVERVDGFDRERGPEYPAFRREALPDGRLRVERFDAEGEIDVDARPLRAHFRVGPSPNSLEACLRIAASLALPRAGALILHASAVVHGGRALVFSGHSGAGKSTISAMLPAADPAWSPLADELLVLRRADDGGGWEVVVPPYLGPAGIAHGARAPLAGIHFLVQAPFDRRDRLANGAALRGLLRNVLVYVAEPATAAAVLAVAADVTAATPCFTLHFRKDPQVAAVLLAPATVGDYPAHPGSDHVPVTRSAVTGSEGATS